VNDQAFRLHVVTRGITVPSDLSPEIRTLLRGLLARDPLKRWAAPEVRAWLAGEAVAAPEETGSESAQASGPMLVLGGKPHHMPELFALAAAEAENWAEARELTLRGAVATWLAERAVDPRIVAEVRRLGADDAVSEDLRHALVLMAINLALPLTVHGEILTPAWLLAHPVEGYAVVIGEVSRHLERMAREPWLVRLRARASAVRDRAKLLEIELDEERAQVALLASSRANLEAEREVLRRLFPDTDHAGLSSIVERSRLSDEDLIILISAATHQFIALATLIDTTAETAAQTGVQLDLAALPDLVTRPRREIFALVDQRVANFARCGIQRVDEWADAFRIERRLSLPRVATLLAVPAEAWREPPRQQYVATLLEHFEKRVSGAIGRGPLVRFVLGKTTSRVDLIELGTSLRPAEALLNHVLSRVEIPTSLDPAAYTSDERLEGRLRRLVSHAQTFRRDTGIDGRYLAFPFLVTRDARAPSETAKPRIAPVLLWPVALEVQSGAARTGTLMFDREREEVRLNPALEGLLGGEAFARWRLAREELLARSAIRLGDVMDVFGALATPRARALAPVPSGDTRVAAGTLELAPAAALFNAEFTGQAVAEDLRQMRRMPPAGTALDAALRVSTEPASAKSLPPVPETERYLTVESDPSQEALLAFDRLQLPNSDCAKTAAEGSQGRRRSDLLFPYQRVSSRPPDGAHH